MPTLTHTMCCYEQTKTLHVFKQELQESLQQLLTTKIAVYLMTFLIVTVAWAAHIR